MTLALGQETVAADEAEQIARICALITAMQNEAHPPGETMRRDAHAKHHGVVRATLTVEAHLPPALAVGLFARPRVFDAYVRLSNGEGKPKHDAAPDGRGLAIKVLGVPEATLLDDPADHGTQDFLCIAHHSFFVRTLADYVSLFEGLRHGRLLGHFFGLNPLRWRLREFRHVMKTRIVLSNPLTAQYWSMVPYAYGPGAAARFSVRAQTLENTGVPKGAGRDYLREAMAKTLAARDVAFDFLVQLQTDPVRMPIEDATVPWDEALSPYVKVATLRIPRQTFDTPARQALAEHLSFTPWHAVPEHRPLGSMNRARRQVYQVISALRHSHNGVPRGEPDGSEIVAD